MHDLPNNAHVASSRGIHAGKFFLGLLILAIGLSYLGESIGVVTLNVGYVFQHFWSILIIFIGLSMLSRHSRVAAIFGVVVSALVLFTLFYVVADDSAFQELKRQEKIEVTRAEGTSRAEVRVDAQAAALRIEGGGDKLLSGTFQSPILNLKTKSEVENGVQRVSLDTRDSGGQFGWQYLGKNIGNFYLKLGSDTPTDVLVNSAASDININLTNTTAEHVTLKSSASNIIVAASSRLGTTTIQIESKASTITLRIPKETGARIVFTSDIASKSMPNFNLVENDMYQSANFADATSRVLVTINSPVANLDVVWK